LVYVTSTTVLLSVSALLGLGLLVYLQTGGEEFGQALEAAAQDESAEMLIAAHLLAAPAVWMWTWFFRRRLDLKSFVSLGFPRQGALSRFALGWGTAALIPGLFFVLGWARGYYEITDVRSVAEFPFHGGLGLLYFIVGFLVQGSTEELMLRGYVQRNLAEYRPGSFFWILVLPSALFSLAHLTNPGFDVLPMVNTFLIAMVLGTLVWTEKSIWLAAGLHVGWNFALGCLWSLPVSGMKTPALMEIAMAADRPNMDLLLGGAYGPEGGLLQTIIALLLLATLLPQLERASDDKRNLFA
jgi:membrane protease YdiL (CAAX protease family)